MTVTSHHHSKPTHIPRYHGKDFIVGTHLLGGKLHEEVVHKAAVDGTLHTPTGRERSKTTSSLRSNIKHNGKISHPKAVRFDVRERLELRIENAFAPLNRQLCSLNALSTDEVASATCNSFLLNEEFWEMDVLEALADLDIATSSACAQRVRSRSLCHETPPKMYTEPLLVDEDLSEMSLWDGLEDVGHLPAQLRSSSSLCHPKTNTSGGLSRPNNTLLKNHHSASRAILDRMDQYERCGISIVSPSRQVPMTDGYNTPRLPPRAAVQRSSDHSPQHTHPVHHGSNLPRAYLQIPRAH